MWELFSTLFGVGHILNGAFLRLINVLSTKGGAACIEPDEIQDITSFYHDRCDVAAWRAGACEAHGACV